MTKLGTAVVNEHYALDQTSVKAPFDEDFIEALKIIKSGKRWDADEKLWIFDKTVSKRAILLVSEYFNIEYTDA